MAGLGVSLKLMPPEGRSLILAGALLSITMNPIVFRVTDLIGEQLRTRTGRDSESTSPPGGREEGDSS